MARRRTVLTIPIPAGGVEVADVLAVLTGVAPSYDLTRLELSLDGETPHLVLTAGQRRLRPGVLIGADALPGIDEDWSPAEDHVDRLNRGDATALGDMLTDATGYQPIGIKVTLPRPSLAGEVGPSALGGNAVPDNGAGMMAEG